MTTAAALRQHYVRESTMTASPARLLIMLYDRLVADVQGAETAIRRADVPEAHHRLTHAQQIVRELRTSLDTSAWDGADGLAALYDYLLEQLVTANVTKDATTVSACREVVEPLAQAWHEAAARAVGAAS